MKRTTANQTLVISWTFWRRRRLFRPLAVVMISVSQGDFPCLFIMHTATARDRESRRFNRDGGTSRKAIIHGLRSLHFCAGALNGFDIPWWITTTKWGGERRGGRARKRESKRLKRKIQEEFFALTPSGRSVCWWSTVRFSGKRISSLPPTRVSQTESQRRSSFIQPECACSRVAHLLLIKQWQALKTLFDRKCGN